MVAKVKRIVPTLPTNQVSPEIHNMVRSFCAEVESFPWESRSRKPIANSVPTAVKLPIRDRYLKTIVLEIERFANLIIRFLSYWLKER